MKIKRFTSIAFFMLFSSYVQAAFVDYPIPPGYSFTGTIEVVDSLGTSQGVEPVDFNPAQGDFAFSYLDIAGFGHDSEIYTSPGTYTFWSTPDPVFPTSVELSMTLDYNQIGMRSFIDWNNNTYDILTVWDMVDSGSELSLVATDMNGDGVRGYQMVSGPLAGLNVIMDATIVTPIPAAFWLFGSGILCMAGFLRRRKRDI